jgi:hypothetical protein
MKKFIILGLILACVYVAFNLQVFAEEAPGCPEGTTQHPSKVEGEPLCKINPTGCVHGDSIPLEECHKFDENTTSHNTETPEVIEFGGFGK